MFGIPPPPTGLPTVTRGIVETMRELKMILRKVSALLHEVPIDEGDGLTNLVSARFSTQTEICSNSKIS